FVSQTDHGRRPRLECQLQRDSMAHARFADADGSFARSATAFRYRGSPQPRPRLTMHASARPCRASLAEKEMDNWHTLLRGELVHGPHEAIGQRTEEGRRRDRRT